MKNAIRTCNGCGTEIVPGERERNKKKWCSEACRSRYYRENTPGAKEKAAKRARERAVKIEADKPARPKCFHCSGYLNRRREGSKFCTKPDCQKAKRKHDASIAPDCSMGGCERPQLARGLCGSHYAIAWGRRNPDKLFQLKARRRAALKGVFVEDISRDVVLERDGWRCGLCGERIPRSAVYPDPKSPSIDHVLPLSKGGLHCYANVQAAHLSCNCAKSDGGGGEQLAII